MDIVERSDAAGSLTLSSFERGRSRNPHPAVSANTESEVEITAPVSETAIQPRRETTTIVPIPEETELETDKMKRESKDIDGPGKPVYLDDETTPTASPKDPQSPDLPILRVNSEDIS
jgi:hypothetical protein